MIFHSFIISICKFLKKPIVRIWVILKEFLEFIVTGFIAYIIFIMVFWLKKQFDTNFLDQTAAEILIIKDIEFWGSTIVFAVFVLLGILRMCISTYFDIINLCLVRHHDTEHIKNKLLNMGGLPGKTGQIFKNVSEDIQDYNPESE